MWKPSGPSGARTIEYWSSGARTVERGGAPRPGASRVRLAAHPTFASDLERALVDTFEACDAAMDARWAAEEKPPHVSSGTTAVVAVLRGNSLVVASVGDSRCVVATSDGDDLSGISLTTDHDPSLPVEKARITAAGGYVVDGRVFLDADGTQLGLAMSRSLGDRRLKAAGVVSTPTLQTRDVKGDAYVVLATDGIWQVLGVDAVARALEGDEADAEYSCKNLIIEATALWGLEVSDYRDDITCMVVKCNPLTLTDVQASYVSVAAVRKHPVKERAPEPTSTRDVEVPRGQSIVLDTVGDGKYDTLGIDTSGDGRADTFGAPRLFYSEPRREFYAAEPVDTNATGVEDHFKVFVDQPRRASVAPVAPDPEEIARRQASKGMAEALASPKASDTQREAALNAHVAAIDAALEKEKKGSG
ncbi:protein serine/threonine phosphatase [Aureococcus anophagefferens]|nr:protein serine/threonine phosphatase [Aureococcus anophagefferens]